MFNYKVVFVLASLLMAETALGKRGGPRGNRNKDKDGDGDQDRDRDRDRDKIHQRAFMTATLTCADDEESVPCASAQVTGGVLACRTFPVGLADPEGTKTVCADPAVAHPTDFCGCCDGPCTTDCPCECNGETGYWIIKNCFGSDCGYKYGVDDDDIDAEDEAVEVLVCAPKLRAITAVASGKATCLDTCNL